MPEHHQKATSPDECGIYLITGTMASGKSAVAELLARRFARGVHLRGDSFRRMIVSGREEMLPEPSPEAERQLKLRYRLAADAAETYFAAGFTVVVQDVIVGPVLQGFVDQFVSRPLFVVVLTPNPQVVALREAGRSKQGYGLWTIAQLDDLLRNHTPRLGLWLDTSALTAEQTVDQILLRAQAEAAQPPRLG